jgi:pimeloyl-ACP methyl ester carboxylesterase
MFNRTLMVLVAFFLFAGASAHSAEVISLIDDKRFDDKIGDEGMYHPESFKHAGIYLTQEIDPQKEVVILVHGAKGHPGEFRDIVEALPSRYQAWLVYYPTGLRAAEAGAYLAEQVSALAAKHGIQRVRVLAHSFGGIVAWDMASRVSSSLSVVELITIATPWNGHWAARLSVWLPSKNVPSWLDLVPGNDKLKEIWSAASRPAHTLVFAVEQDSPTASGDGTISRESQLAPDMAKQAKDIIQLVGTHTSVLHEQQCVSAIVARFI